jgi:putative inorganic carbon (hco3(-)) transporter
MRKLFNLENLIYPHTQKIPIVSMEKNKFINAKSNLFQSSEYKLLGVGVYLTIIFLPAYLIRLNIFGIPTNILEILILLIFIGWIINFKKDAINRVSAINYRKYIFSVTLIFLGLLISTIAGKNYAAGIGIIKGWFFFPIFFVFLAGRILEKDKIINVYKTLYLSAFLVSLVALGYLFLGKITYDGRLQGFFNSPNYLAMCIAPSLLMLVQTQSAKLKAQNYSLKLKTVIIISGIIILIAFYFTYSYAAWIAVGLSLIIISVIKNKELLRNKAVIIISLLIILLFIIQLNNEKLVNLKNYNRSSLESRIMIWQSARKILSDNWIWGIGPGNFQEKYLEYQKYYPPYLEWAVSHPHNIYLTFWLYGGIIGLLGFIILIFYFFADIFKEIKGAGCKPAPANVVQFIALGTMLYILIHGVADTTYFKNDLAVIFWLNFLVLKK